MTRCKSWLPDNEVCYRSSRLQSFVARFAAGFACLLGEHPGFSNDIAAVVSRATAASLESSDTTERLARTLDLSAPGKNKIGLETVAAAVGFDRAESFSSGDPAANVLVMAAVDRLG
jgi:predicted naringenin-chalcone synthase